MREGDFERALDRFEAAWKEKPGHPGVHYLYADAVSGLKRSGDQAFERGRAEEAGRKWTTALQAMTNPAAKGRPIPFERSDLRGAIDRLTAQLLERAVVDYRKGDLEAAMARWRAVLSYDSSNAEAARSLRTATTQVENLKKLAPAR